MNVDDKKRKDSAIRNWDSMWDALKRDAFLSIVLDVLMAICVILVGCLVGAALMVPYVYNYTHG